jgi:hypothetical protein
MQNKTERNQQKPNKATQAKQTPKTNKTATKTTKTLQGDKEPDSTVPKDNGFALQKGLVWRESK